MKSKSKLILSKDLCLYLSLIFFFNYFILNSLRFSQQVTENSTSKINENIHIFPNSLYYLTTAKISSVDDENSTIRLLFCQIEKAFPYHFLPKMFITWGKKMYQMCSLRRTRSNIVWHILLYAKTCFVCYCYRLIRLRTVRSSFDNRVCSYASLRK
jgi:hypothetical protein